MYEAFGSYLLLRAGVLHIVSIFPCPIEYGTDRYSTIDTTHRSKLSPVEPGGHQAENNSGRTNKTTRVVAGLEDKSGRWPFS